jgi:glycosyltransferase involved in cell wall biosynthesis
MIRILYIHHGKGIGGAPLSLLYLIKGLDKSRFHPAVLFLYESEAVDLFCREGIETYTVKGIDDFSHTNVLWYDVLKLPKLLWRLAKIPISIYRASRFLRNYKFDIVHLNTSTLSACAIASKRAGLKVVWHIREPLSRGYFGIRRHFIRRIIWKYSDKIIPICYYDAEQLTPTSKIQVVYNFVDFSKFNRTVSGKSFRDKFGIGGDLKLVGMLGGVNRIKGTKEFVQAAKHVMGRGRTVVFLVIGGYPQPRTFLERLRVSLNGEEKYFGQVIASVDREHLKKNVVFTGVQQNVPEVIAALDVVVFPSTVPHFARPIIEAGAMAKPVVASKLGGPEELVINGITGMLVEPRDPKSLAEAIIELIDDDEKRKRMGEEGYKRARILFDAETNVKQVMKIYDELVGDSAIG